MNLNYIGKNLLRHTLELKKGNVSGSVSSTGSFGAGFIDNKLGIGTSSPETNLHLGTSKTFKLGTGNTNTTSLEDGTTTSERVALSKLLKPKADN